MLDDLPPVDGHVLPDDARRLAEGRTLVNLDAVDFAPILAALKPLGEAARQYAEWQADGWIGDAGHELLSQTAKRWTALESALVGAGMTENAAWTFDIEKANAEQINATWFILRDLFLDMRKGKFGPQGKFGPHDLAKRLAVAVDMVQGLTPITSDATATPPAVSKSGKLILAALLKRSPALLTIEEICDEVKGDSSERTIGPELKTLIDTRFAVRPNGPRKGATLTAAGKALAEKLSPS